MEFRLGQNTVDSVELKCLVVSRGLKVDKEVYQKCGKAYRIYPNALTCNSFRLPDGTVVMTTDLGFHLSTLSSMFSWDNLKLFRYMGDMTTDFRLTLAEGAPMLLWQGREVTPVQLMPASDFYRQKTGSGLPFAGNAVLQGCDWVAFQCLWPCEFACAGKPCQYCFSGGQFEALARRRKPMPPIPSPQDVADVVLYAARHDGVNSMQLTGGSTFRGGGGGGAHHRLPGAPERDRGPGRPHGGAAAVHNPAGAARADRPILFPGGQPHRLQPGGVGRPAGREHHPGQAQLHHQGAAPGRPDLYCGKVRPGEGLFQFHHRSGTL